MRGSSWCGCRKSRSIRRAWPATTLFYRRRSRLRCVSNPGVLALYAVAAKEAPGQVTILEIYADRAAYESHITTPHFRKYKEGTLDMVLSLELVDVVPLMPGLELRQTVGTR